LTAKHRLAALALVSFAGLFASGCKQAEGQVCENYPSGDSDCGSGLECCPGPTPRSRGICVTEGTCTEVVPVDAGARDGGSVDAGRLDAGEVDAGEVDAGTDAGEVELEDAGTDAGEIDAGVDAGP
jgi:hypothetical protein